MKVKAIVREDTETKNFIDFETDYWEMRWTVGGLEKFGKNLQKKVDKRDDWVSVLYQEIMKKMKFRVAKDVSITLEYIDHQNNVIEFADQIKKQLIARIKFDEVSKQATIDEAIEAKGGKISPASKESSQDKSLKDDLKNKKSAAAKSPGKKK